MTDSLKTVASFESPLDAEIAKGRLESEDIIAHIRDESTVNANWLLSNAIGGVKLLVKESDLSRASDLLQVVATSEEDEGWGSCSSCGSRQLELRDDRRITNLTWLMFGIPLLFPRKKFFCRSCGNLSKSPAR
jgi:hypothetical protein